MKDRIKANLVPCLICFAIAGALASVYVSLRDFDAAALVEKYRILCDAFTIPGISFLMLGVLFSVSNAGALDGIGYALRHMFKMLIPGDPDKHERYYDYVERKRANRKKGYGCLYVTGVVFTAISLIFMALFYSLYQK